MLCLVPFHCGDAGFGNLLKATQGPELCYCSMQSRDMYCSRSSRAFCANGLHSAFDVCTATTGPDQQHDATIRMLSQQCSRGRGGVHLCWGGIPPCSGGLGSFQRDPLSHMPLRLVLLYGASGANLEW